MRTTTSRLRRVRRPEAYATARPRRGDRPEAYPTRTGIAIQRHQNVCPIEKKYWK